MNQPILRVLLILVFSTFCAEVVQTVILPTLPQMSKDLGVSAGVVQSSFLCFFLATVFANFFSPFFSNWLGETKTYLLGLIIAFTGAMISFVLLNFFPKIQILFLGRSLEGFGIQLAATFNQVFIGWFFSKEQSIGLKSYKIVMTKTQVFSILFKVLTITGILAPILGSYLMHVENWQFTFFASGLFLLLLIISFLPSYQAYAFRESKKNSFKDILMQAKEIVKHPSFLIFSFLSSSSTLMIVFYLIKSPFVYIDIFLCSPKIYALINFFPIIGSVIGASFVTFLSHRYSSYRLMKMGVLGFVFVSGFGFVLQQISPMPLIIFTINISLVLCCCATINPIATALALECRNLNLTVMSAMLNLIQMLACVLASFFASSLPDQILYLFGFALGVSVFVLLGERVCQIRRQS